MTDLTSVTHRAMSARMIAAGFSARYRPGYGKGVAELVDLDNERFDPAMHTHPGDRGDGDTHAADCCECDCAPVTRLRDVIAVAFVHSRRAAM